MINTNELRRKVNSTDIVDHIDLHANIKPFLSEMIDRLEAAEADALEQARLNGMGSEREAALMAKLEAAEKTNREWLRANAPGGWIDNLRIENEALRAKIERMEKQEPVWFIDERGEPKRYHKSKADYCKYGGLDLLYALPGAKGEEK